MAWVRIKGTEFGLSYNQIIPIRYQGKSHFLKN